MLQGCGGGALSISCPNGCTLKGGCDNINERYEYKPDACDGYVAYAHQNDGKGCDSWKSMWNDLSSEGKECYNNAMCCVASAQLDGSYKDPDACSKVEEPQCEDPKTQNIVTIMVHTIVN